MLVYSTDPNVTVKAAKEPDAPVVLSQVTAVLRIEKAGRSGKTVTVIDRLPLNEAFLKEWTVLLKKKCGSGGTYMMDKEHGVIEIQGDKRDLIRDTFVKKGIKVKG